MSGPFYSTNKNSHIFNISNFKKDGFEKVCDVHSLKNKKWFFENVNKELLFSEHRSWVYFITIDNQIVKCGETGNPLGIRGKVEHCQRADGSIMSGTQPKPGSTNRFGRLANQPSSPGRGADTDEMLREEIEPFYTSGLSVELWARKCQVHPIKTTILNEIVEEFTTIHKNLELAYLNLFKNTAGCLPAFNRNTK
jgi:hypothetical protein